MRPILELELFNLWGVDFMGPFMSFFSMKYILVAIYYVSKWVEAVEFPNNEGRSVTTFFKKYIFSRFDHVQSLVKGDHISVIIYYRVYLRIME